MKIDHLLIAIEQYVKHANFITLRANILYRGDEGGVVILQFLRFLRPSTY